MKTQLRKIYYVPGLISAIIIPLVFWYFAENRIDKTIYTVVDLGIPAKSSHGMYESSFEPYRKWNYIKIKVEPSTALKNQDFYVSELRKLQKLNEKESGIEFIIGNENTYQDLIALIDAMILSKQDRYGLDMEKTGHFFAVHKFVDPNLKEMEFTRICGYEMINVKYPESDLNGLYKFSIQLSQLPKNAYYIIFGFLIFLNITMLNIKKFL